MPQSKKKDEQPASRIELSRAISFTDYISIGVGVMIGVGWVVYAGEWVLRGGIVGASLAFIVGGLILIPIGKCYAELTSAIPVAGGAVAFTYKAFGPFVSFLSAWALTLAYVSITPFETIAMGAMAEAIIPALATPALYEIGGYRISWSTLVPGVLSGLWVTWINWRGARDLARFQSIAVVGMLVGTLAFTAAALWKGDIHNLTPLFAGEGAWWAIVPSSIVAVLVVVPFFLTGFDCIPQAAEESRITMSPRQLGTAIIATIVIGTVFYTLVVLVLGYSVPGSTLREVIAQKNQLPMAEVFRTSLGVDWAAKAILLTALLGIITTLNGVFMAATRLLFAQGRGGLLPKWFAVLHPVHRTPRNAILFVGTVAALGPFVGKAGLLPIVDSYSLVISIVLLMTALATWRLRRTAPDLPRPYRIHKATICVAIVVGALLVSLMVLPGSPGYMGRTASLTAGLWMVVGLVFYGYRQRRESMDSETQARMILADR